jgi:hypothetical protein
MGQQKLKIRQSAEPTVIRISSTFRSFSSCFHVVAGSAQMLQVSDLPYRATVFNLYDVVNDNPWCDDTILQTMLTQWLLLDVGSTELNPAL